MPSFSDYVDSIYPPKRNGKELAVVCIVVGSVYPVFDDCLACYRCGWENGMFGVLCV